MFRVSKVAIAIRMALVKPKAAEAVRLEKSIIKYGKSI